MKTLIMTVGLPGSGKSTWVQTQDAAVISPDANLVRADGTYGWTLARADAAWSHAYCVLGLRLTDPGCVEPTIFDACFVSAMDRRAILNICKGAGVEVCAEFFDTPLEECIRRNYERTADRKVPEERIHAMARRLEAPTLREGFAEIVTHHWYGGSNDT